MKRSFRFAALLLSFLLLLSLTPASFALAETDEEYTAVARPRIYPDPENRVFPALRMGVDDYRAALADFCDVDALRASLLSQMLEHKETLDVSDFAIPIDQIDAVLHFLWRAMPEALVDPGESVQYSYGGGKLLSVLVTYLPEASDAEACRAMYDAFTAAAEEMLEGVKDNDGLTDLEKALILHDRLAVACTYDYENYRTNTVPSISHSGYGAFNKGVAVCQGYTAAYLYLMDQIGVPCITCESSAINHIWNIVTIDGEKYHVDVTWDDPAPAYPGLVLHENFLRSTDGIKSTGHNATDFDPSPVSTLYDSGAWWEELEDPLALIGNDFYYMVSDNAVVRRTAGQEETVFTVDQTWRAGATASWGQWSHLAQAGDVLLYTTPDSVMEWDPATGGSRAVFQPDLTAVGDYAGLYALSYENGEIVCWACPGENGPNGLYNDAHTEFRAAYAPPVKTETGDVNGDGQITDSDAVYLLYFTFFPEEYPLTQDCDFTGDGRVTDSDAVYLLYHIFFPEEYPLPAPAPEQPDPDPSTDPIKPGGSESGFIPRLP